MSRTWRRALLAAAWASSACSLTLDPDDLGAGCPTGTRWCGGVCAPLGEEDACDECGVGQFERDGQCVAWTACQADEFESAAPTRFTDRECRPITRCEPGSYEATAPSPTSDRTCAACPEGSFTDTPNATRCTDWALTPKSVVEIRAPFVDDLAILTVNGVRHPVGHFHQPETERAAWRDVSAWFSGGANQIRLFAINTWGPQGLTFQLRLDGATVFDFACQVEGCVSRPNGGVFVDRVIELPELRLPPSRKVTVTSVVPGKLYLNDDYTGLTTPATLELPVGSHRLGLGVSSDVPGALSGEFYEEVVTIAYRDVEIRLGDEPPLGPRNAARIAILPLRRARALDSGGVAVLSDAEIPRFVSQLEATRDTWIEPFSYGLATWDITLLPTEEEIEMVGATYESFPDHACEVLQTAKYADLLSHYDVVLVHFSNYDAERQLEIGQSSAGMGGRCGQIQSRVTAEWAPHQPSPTILHALLYAYDTHHQTTLGRYNGLNGPDGASDHGFPEVGSQGETHWVEWYRYFIRGQVPERAELLPGGAPSAPESAPDFYVGPFSSFRHGLWLAR